MERYKVTYKSERPTRVFDAQEGIYFDLDCAKEAFGLIVDELNGQREQCGKFSVKMEQVTCFGDTIWEIKNYES